MNEFSIFHHEKFGDIRVTEENGITWFVGIDVCNVLLATKIQGMRYINMWIA